MGKLDLEKLLNGDRSEEQSDDENSLVQDAQNAPVRPEYLNLFNQAKSDYPNLQSSFLTPDASPEHVALNNLNKLDNLSSTKETSPNSLSAYDDMTLSGLRKIAYPSDDQQAGQYISNSPSIEDLLKLSTPQSASLPSSYQSPDLLSQTSLSNDDSDSDLSDQSIKYSQASTQRNPGSVTIGGKNDASSTTPSVADTLAKLLGDNRAEMLPALQAQSSGQLLAGLARAGQMAGAALTPLANIKPNEEGLKQLEASANLPLQQMQAMKAGDKETLAQEELKRKLSDEMEKSRPDSDVSKFYRGFLQKMGVNVGDTTSAASLDKVLPVIEKYFQKQNNDFYKSNFKNSMQEIQINRLMSNLVPKINNDTLIKPSALNLASLEKSKALLNNPNMKITSSNLADAENDIASALTLRGQGATEGKIKRTELRDLQRKISELKQHVGLGFDDLRQVDPELVDQIRKTNSALIDDYNTTINKRYNKIFNQYGSAFGSDPRFTDRLRKMKESTLADIIDSSNDSTATPSNSSFPSSLQQAAMAELQKRKGTSGVK